MIFSSGIPWIPEELKVQKMWQITKNFTKSKRREQTDMGNPFSSQISDSLICVKDKGIRTAGPKSLIVSMLLLHSVYPIVDSQAREGSGRSPIA